MNSKITTAIIICVAVIVIGYFHYLHAPMSTENPTQNMEKTDEKVSSTVNLKVGESTTIGSLKIMFTEAQPATVKAGPAEVFLEPQYVFTFTDSHGGNGTFTLSKFKTVATTGGYRFSINSETLAAAEKTAEAASTVSITIESIN